jgi:hypothetical protein
VLKIFKNSAVLTATTTSIAIATTSLIPIDNYQTAQAATGAYCQFTPEEIAAKESLLKSSFDTSNQASREYSAIVEKHAEMLRLCRSQSWPEEQAIWLRLYPCDASPGSIERVLDDIVNRGYNKIHLEVFYDSQVLLPAGDNPTPWTPVVSTPGAENIDLLEQTIEKAHQRGLKVYAWLFTMNFGYTYAQRPDRQNALARNGVGDNSLTFVHDRSQAFIDPYSRQAQLDYQNLVEAILKRQPDGILFDYVRYPRGSGKYSSVNNVRDLWIYGESSVQALLDRATNQKGKAAIALYLEQGKISINDLAAIDRQYPKETEPSWQGRQLNNNSKSLQDRHQTLQKDLWFFTVAHAAQGVIDFLSLAARPAQSRGIPAGAVFFPDANRMVGRAGFDSRLQAWDKFPSTLEWHSMAYGVCNGTECIENEVETVLKASSEGTKVIPALAGVWGQTYREHPSLEQQMEALRKFYPEIDSVSHFGYSWQEPAKDRQRQSCRLQ